MNTDDLIIIWHLKRLQDKKDQLIPLCLHILQVGAERGVKEETLGEEEEQEEWENLLSRLKTFTPKTPTITFTPSSQRGRSVVGTQVGFPQPNFGVSPLSERIENISNRITNFSRRVNEDLQRYGVTPDRVPLGGGGLGTIVGQGRGGVSVSPGRSLYDFNTFSQY
eukprot:SAG11_NODE_13704_length_642_cov_746.790055_1_plen_166_part_00